MSTLKTLAVATNVSAAHKLEGKSCALLVTTSESSALTVETSIDGTTFSAVADWAETLNGNAVYNLTDFIPGQYVRVKATSGTMTAVKILAE